MSCAHQNIDDKNSASSQQSSGGSGGPCAECDKPAKLRCANCKKNTGQLVFYCSKECQRANWPRHKNFCSLPIPSKMLTGPIIKLTATPMDSSPSQTSRDDDIKLIDPTSSIIHKRLALELECEIFACLKLPIKRKFISGLGTEIYEMCAPKIRALLKARKLFNPVQNGWDQSTTPVTISADGLTALNVAENSQGCVVIAMHAFPVDSARHCRLDNFAGTIIYYFEVKQRTFGQDFCIGFANWYAPNHNHEHECLLCIGYDSKGCKCGWLICGEYHPFECFEDTIKPEWKWAAREGGNVAGCGLLLNCKNKLAIFGTLNGILLGNPLPIEQRAHCLYPTAMVEPNEILEANFGNHSAKPFEYDIDKCPGMVFE